MTHPIEQGTRSPSHLLLRLEEIVEALDRRRPQIERVGEPEIAADATRLRASAVQRMALLRRPSATSGRSRPSDRRWHERLYGRS